MHQLDMPQPFSMRTALRTLVPRSARNWLRDPRQTLAWGFDHARFVFGRTEMLEVRPGWVLRAHPLAARRAYMAQIADPHQRSEFDAFLAHAQPGMRLLDVGAHFGVFSLAALHYGRPSAFAVAVDPSPAAIAMILLHGRLNGFADRLRVVQACAAGADGECDMLDTGVIGAGYFVAADGGRPRRDYSSVRAIAIDTLCRELAFDPTHIKIDVEGYEHDVLRGAAATLGRLASPIVFLELHNDIIRSRGNDPGEVVEYLGALGYACRDVMSGPPDSRTFSRDVSRLVARRRME